MIKPYKRKPKDYSADKWHEYKRIIGSFSLLDIGETEQQEILEALHDETEWDWWEDCDGCSCVSEPGWPTKYYPPCLRHDYDWGKNPTIASNMRFKRLNKAYHMDTWRAVARFIGVCVSLPFYKTWRFFSG